MVTFIGQQPIPKTRKLQRLLHSPRPGLAILYAVSQRLVEQWRTLRDSDPGRTEISSTLMVIQGCISRVKSDLEV